MGDAGVDVGVASAVGGAAVGVGVASAVGGAAVGVGVASAVGGVAVGVSAGVGDAVVAVDDAAVGVAGAGGSEDVGRLVARSGSGRSVGPLPPQARSRAISSKIKAETSREDRGIFDILQLRKLCSYALVDGKSEHSTHRESCVSSGISPAGRFHFPVWITRFPSIVFTRFPPPLLRG